MRYLWRSVLVLVVMAASVSAAPVATSSTAPLPATWQSAPTQEPGSACAARDTGRFSDCKSGVYMWNIREGNGGEVIGTVDVSFTISETTATQGSRAWTAQYSVFVTNLTGVATSGTTAAVVPECGGGCTTRGGLPDNGAPLAINQTLSGDISFASPGTSVSTSTQEIAIYLFHPAAAGTGTTKGDPRSVLGPVRCDSATPAEHLGATGRPGCVMSNVAPTLDLASDWGQGPTPAHDAFVRRAQANPKTAGYGRVGSGRPLIREYLPPSEQAKKRYQVCGRSSADGEGTCDEYPYSSSRQGVPDYAVTGSVPGDQNYRAGRKLSSFYANAHVLDGDPYNVRP